jgi:amidase
MPNIAPPMFDQKAFDILNKHNPAVGNVFFNSVFMNEMTDANAVLAKAIGHVKQLRDAFDEAL